MAVHNLNICTLIRKLNLRLGILLHLWSCLVRRLYVKSTFSIQLKDNITAAKNQCSGWHSLDSLVFNVYTTTCIIQTWNMAVALLLTVLQRCRHELSVIPGSPPLMLSYTVWEWGQWQGRDLWSNFAQQTPNKLIRSWWGTRKLKHWIKILLENERSKAVSDVVLFRFLMNSSSSKKTFAFLFSAKSPHVSERTSKRKNCSKMHDGVLPL